jgi:UDP-glucose 4-epimerase
MPGECCTGIIFIKISSLEVKVKTILLVGGAGFIGSYIADRLTGEGYRVVVADSLLLGSKQNIQHLLNRENLRFIQADFSILAETEKIFAANRFDTVFHFAANSDIQASEKDPGRDLDNTFMTTVNILECMRKYSVKELLFASSSAIYGDMKEAKIHEDLGPLFPISYYGGAKLASEAFIASYSFMNNIQSWIFRFPNVIGERLTHGVVYDFIRRLKNNPAELAILGNGKQTKPYLYVQDLVNAIFLIWEKADQMLNYFNIGVDTRTSVTEIANIICEEMGLENVAYIYSGGDVGWKGDVPEFQYELNKVRLLGWKPSYTSSEAIRASVRGIIQHGGGNFSRGDGHQT